MHSKLNVQIRKVLLGSVLGGVALFHCSGASASIVSRVEQTAGKYYTVNAVTLSDGKILEETIIHGPPTPPPGFEAERQAVSLPVPDSVAGAKSLTVPTFNWVFGCSAVSGAMIAGYYDRSGFSNIYTGPTNGGVMPLDNSSWPTWSDGDTTYPNCPLIASKNGVDGRTTRGSIDDYWVLYGSTASDPYITGSWTQHTWGDAIGDYMMTSQSAFGNSDGSTTFWNYNSSKKLTCDEMASSSLNDGTLGRKQFYEARGYGVKDCYNKKTDNIVKGGFSFANFKAEINAGHPVMLNLEGHTIVGVGYNSSTKTIYIHDTWDYLEHTMTWGGSYSGMELQSVSIVHLAPPPKISVSPMSINFGSLKSGVASSPKSVTIKDSATGGSKLAIGVMEITGDDASDFTLSNPCPDLLAKGDSCKPSVTITSSSFGKKSATLSISSDDPKKPVVLVKLAATVVPPTISVSPSSLNFGKVKTGTNTATRVIKIKNTGLSDLKINSLTLSGDITPSVQENTCGASIAKGVSCTVSVAISPASVGPKTGVLKISSNDPKKLDVLVNLKGTATSP